MIPTSAQPSKTQRAPGRGDRSRPSSSPSSLPCSEPSPAATQHFPKHRGGFSPLREPRMMLRLCNANRCGVYNYSWLSWGGACCCSPWDAPGQSMGGSIPVLLPRECPPSRGETAPGEAPLGLPSVLPSQESIFLPLDGKTSHLQGSSGAGRACGVPWLAAVSISACGDAALLASAGYIPPPTLP